MNETELILIEKIWLELKYMNDLKMMELQASNYSKENWDFIVNEFKKKYRGDN